MKKMMMTIGFISIVLFATACASKEDAYFMLSENESQNKAAYTQTDAAQEKTADTDGVQETGDKTADAAQRKTDGQKQTENTSQATDTLAKNVCCVYVCGAVVTPGVYELPEGSRVASAIEAAGGFTAEASTVSMNLAEYVTDGQMIRILSVEEATQAGGQAAIDQSATDGTAQSAADDPATAGADSSRVNINVAGKEQLMTLTGIGESKAESIIEYRESNGRFAAIEDIMQIAGIKQGVYDKIKDSITVD